MIRLILLYCLPLLANADSPHVPEIPTEIVSEKADYPHVPEIPTEIVAEKADYPHVPEIPTEIVSEKAEFSPLEETADSCPLCTPAERNQLRIKEAERMAKSLNSLVAELEQLVRYPEVSNLLLSEEADGDVLHQINRILGYMRQQQRPVAVSKAAPAVTSVNKTAVVHGKQSLAGLRPVFAQPADLDRGINANVILRSHRDDVILNIGEQLTHNNVRYILYSVRQKDGVPEIVLQDSAGRKQVLLWR